MERVRTGSGLDENRRRTGHGPGNFLGTGPFPFLKRERTRSGTRGDRKRSTSRPGADQERMESIGSGKRNGTERDHERAGTDTRLTGDGTAAERQRNGNGTETERKRNGNGTETERKRNGNGTETERTGNVGGGRSWSARHATDERDQSPELRRDTNAGRNEFGG